MDKETWTKLSRLLVEESNKVYTFHKEASQTLVSLALVCEKMGKKTKDELLTEAAEYGNSLR